MKQGEWIVLILCVIVLVFFAAVCEAQAAGSVSRIAWKQACHELRGVVAQEACLSMRERVVYRPILQQDFRCGEVQHAWGCFHASVYTGGRRYGELEYVRTLPRRARLAVLLHESKHAILWMSGSSLWKLGEEGMERW